MERRLIFRFMVIMNLCISLAQGVNRGIGQANNWCWMAAAVQVLSQAKPFKELLENNGRELLPLENKLRQLFQSLANKNRQDLATGSMTAFYNLFWEAEPRYQASKEGGFGEPGDFYNYIFDKRLLSQEWFDYYKQDFMWYINHNRMRGGDNLRAIASPLEGEMKLYKTGATQKYEEEINAYINGDTFNKSVDKKTVSIKVPRILAYLLFQGALPENNYQIPENLNIYPDTTQAREKEKGIAKRYNLFAISTFRSGHHAAVVKQENGEWWYYDTCSKPESQKVSEEDMKTLLSTGTYKSDKGHMCFYVDPTYVVKKPEPKLHPGVNRGITHQANWCWMTSAVQVLSKIKPLRNALEKERTNLEGIYKNLFDLFEKLEETGNLPISDQMKTLYNSYFTSQDQRFGKMSEPIDFVMSILIQLSNEKLFEPYKKDLFWYGKMSKRKQVEGGKFQATNESEDVYLPLGGYILDYGKENDSKHRDSFNVNFNKSINNLINKKESDRIHSIESLPFFLVGSFSQPAQSRDFSNNIPEYLDIYINTTEAKKDGIKRRYYLFAVNFVVDGYHHTALVKQDNGEWWYYDTLGGNDGRELIENSQLKEILKTKVKKDHNGMAFKAFMYFYQSYDYDISVKIKLLKSALMELQKKLKAFPQKLQLISASVKKLKLES